MAPATKDEAKKRKSSSSTSSATGVSPSKADNGGGASASSLASDRAALHAKVSRLEEDEARARDGGEDAALFAGAAASLARILEQVHDARTKKPKTPATAAELQELRVRASMQVLTLKRLNRLDKLRGRESRERTQAAKQRVDALHLHLQNLQYEAMHLQKEIAKCQQYRSGDEDMALVSEQEFYREAPESISRKEETKSDEHKRRLARLEYEDATRRQMNAQLRELEANKDKVEDIIKRKRDGLASLGPQLGAILKATLPTQEYLGLPLTRQWEQARLCQVLPPPLFVLYSQTSAFAEASDKLVRAEILGDLEEARQFRARALLAEDDDDDSNNATQEDEEDGGGGGKSKRGKASSSSSKAAASRQEQRVAALLEAHPLKVRVRVQLRRGEATAAVLTFSHLSRLGVVAVRVRLEGDDALGVSTSAAAILQPAALLSHLLSDSDDGVRSPNPANRFQLLEVGVADGALPAKQAEELGSLYRWAQLLAGLVHPKQDDETNVSPEVMASVDVGFAHVSNIIAAIRERVLARLALQRQIALLEKAKHIQVEPKVPESALGWFPEDASSAPASKGGSRIRNWTSVDWEQYTKLGVTRHLVDSKAVSGDDHFYRLQINRDPASLIALIAVKPDYPRRAPVFCLNLHWRGEHNLGNSEHIRELERLVNVGFADGGEEADAMDAECREHLLSLQLKRLLTSLDALLEAWNASERGDKVDFPREKHFFKAVGGRVRGLPLHFDKKQQIFEHL